MAWTLPASGGTGTYQPPALSPLAQRAYLESLRKLQLGQMPQESDGGHGLLGSIASFLPDPIERTIMGPAEMASLAGRQIGEALIYSPVGLYEMGKGLALDVTTESQQGNFFPHTRAALEAMGRSVVEDVRHPRERPGYLLMDVVTAASLGAGGALRVAKAGEVARAGLTQRAVEAGRRPPPPPPSAHIPTGPEPPLVPPPPERFPAPSELADIPVKNPVPLDLKKGRMYRVQTDRGEVFDWEYRSTSGLYTRKTHYFRDPETGRRRQISDAGLRRVTLAQQPPIRPGPGPGIPELTTATGRLKDAAGRWASKLEEVVDEPTKVEAQLAKEAAEGTPIKVPNEPAFGPVPGVTGQRANIDTGLSIGWEQEGGKWAVVSYRGGERKVGASYATEAEAREIATNVARRVMNPPGGGSPAPSLGQIAADVGKTLIAPRPPATTRTIEVFRPQKPVYELKEGQYLPDETGKLFEKPQPGGTQHGETMRGQKEAARIDRLPDELDEQMHLFPEERRQPLNQIERWDPETKSMVLDTGEMVPAQIAMSRNPLMRAVQNLQLDLMERNPTARSFVPGPYLGRNLQAIHKLNTKEAARVKAAVPPGVEQEANTKIAQYEHFKRMGRMAQAQAVLDSMNMMAKLFVLYMKPAYYTANAIGQTALTMADHAWNPANLAKSVRMQWAINKDPGEGALTQEWVRQGMGEGVSLHFAGEQGVGILPGIRQRIGPVIPYPGGRRHIPGYEQFAGAANKLLDTPFRDATFYNEARRHGFDTPEKVHDLRRRALEDDPAAIEQAELIFRESNKNIIDYARMGSFEKEWVRRIIFFYPWFKGATIYTGRFVSQHPAQAQIATRMGVEASDKAKKELGPLPSYLSGAGVFKAGEREVPGLGKVPTIINPQSAGVLGTAGEAGAALQALAFGGGGEAHQLSQYLTPGVSAALTAVTRKDPFTGADIPANQGAPEVMINQLLRVPAILRLREQLGRARGIESGSVDPKDILHPYSEEEAWGRFGLGLAPYALNPKVARSRAFAEERSLASRREREVLNAQDYRRQYLEAGRETGLFDEMPEALSRALANRGLREAEIATFQESIGHDLTPLDRLTSDVNLLVRQGRLTPEQGERMLESMLAASENQLQAYRERLAQAFWGTGIISQYRSALNARGAELTV